MENTTLFLENSKDGKRTKIPSGVSRFRNKDYGTIAFKNRPVLFFNFSDVRIKINNKLISEYVDIINVNDRITIGKKVFKLKEKNNEINTKKVII